MDDFSHNPNDLENYTMLCYLGDADLAVDPYVTGVNVVNWPLSRVVVLFCISICKITV
jgi:dolichol-phosphate mannosyltransferase